MWASGVEEARTPGFYFWPRLCLLPDLGPALARASVSLCGKLEQKPLLLEVQEGLKDAYGGPLYILFPCFLSWFSRVVTKITPRVDIWVPGSQGHGDQAPPSNRGRGCSTPPTCTPDWEAGKRGDQALQDLLISSEKLCQQRAGVSDG